ncbi:MAG TPA: hypothetical protein VIU62_04120, partial [Chloroflexota bacterium]
DRPAPGLLGQPLVDNVRALLFFDDWPLHRRQHLSRHVGRPRLVPEGTLEDPFVDPGWGYPTVFQEPETGRWRCVYQGNVGPGPDTRVPVVAESDDAIHWRIPDLSATVPLARRLTPHQLFGVERFLQWSGAYADPQAVGTDTWLKGLVIERGAGGAPPALLVTSPDGLHWRSAAADPWHPTGADPITAAFWNPYRQSHVLTMRPAHNDRRIALSETRDWQSFTPLELALQADALDTPCAEIYGMPVIPYAGMFVGLLWLYHPSTVIDGPNQYYLGKIDCQLAYSHNGWHFQRSLREPFLANSEPGTHGAGCLYPMSVVAVGDELRVYSSATKAEHGEVRRNPANPWGAILLHTLRKDGFVYLEADGGPGELVTRTLLWHGGESQFNVAAPQGEMRVQVLDINGAPLAGYGYDDCVPLRGDAMDWTPQWREGRMMAALGERIVRLAVRLSNGRLYAIRGRFDLMMAGEARLFTERGVRPTTRPGY